MPSCAKGEIKKNRRWGIFFRLGGEGGEGSGPSAINPKLGDKKVCCCTGYNSIHFSYSLDGLRPKFGFFFFNFGVQCAIFIGPTNTLRTKWKCIGNNHKRSASPKGIYSYLYPTFFKFGIGVSKLFIYFQNPFQ